MLYVGKTDKENLESVTHIDKTCRFQSVNEENGCYYELIKTFFINVVSIRCNNIGISITNNIADMNRWRKSQYLLINNALINVCHLLHISHPLGLVILVF